MDGDSLMGEAIFFRRVSGAIPVFGGYTGNYTVSQVTGADGGAYNLYTLTTAGTLTLVADAQVWACGGGGAGRYGNGSARLAGGGGGGGFVTSKIIAPGSYVITIGSGGSGDGGVGSATTIGNVVTANGATLDSSTSRYQGGSGGSGGGAGGWNAASYGIGAGVSTYPFGIVDLKAHCAGGGGGTIFRQNTIAAQGGRGGSNGSNGGSAVSLSTTPYVGQIIAGGAGGVYGGGTGGETSYQQSFAGAYSGEAATFYGSGGGGGAELYCSSSRDDYGIGGAGYQGVVYILEPAS